MGLCKIKNKKTISLRYQAHQRPIFPVFPFFFSSKPWVSLRGFFIFHFHRGRRRTPSFFCCWRETMQSLRGSIRLVRRQCSNNVDLKSNGSHFATATAKFHGSSIGYSNPRFLGSLSKFVCLLTHCTLMYYHLQPDYLFMYLLVY